MQLDKTKKKKIKKIRWTHKKPIAYRMEQSIRTNCPQYNSLILQKKKKIAYQV